MSASIANRKIWEGYRLPDSASDVTYHVDFGGCEAEFAIAETDFLEWCELRGWQPVRVDRATPYFQPVLLPDDERLVEEGYTFSIPDGQGAFDSKRSRAAFWVSSFP